MEIIEIKLAVFLKQDLPFEEANAAIGRFLNERMCEDSDLKAYHLKRCYKYYVFNSFYPIEADKVYKAGRVYMMSLRTLKRDFASKLLPLLRSENDTLKVLSVDRQTKRPHHIRELYTVTPVIVTVNSKPWCDESDVSLFEERLHANLEKKWNFFTGGKQVFQEPFFNRIEFLSLKPIPYRYKIITLLANRIKVGVKEDSASQLLAHMAMGAGLGEKNSSVGAGYCFAN